MSLSLEDYLRFSSASGCTFSKWVLHPFLFGGRFWRGRWLRNRFWWWWGRLCSGDSLARCRRRWSLLAGCRPIVHGSFDNCGLFSFSPGRRFANAIGSHRRRRRCWRWYRFESDGFLRRKLSNVDIALLGEVIR